MGKIGSGIFFGMTLTLIVGLNLPASVTALFLLVPFIGGFVLGNFQFMIKIFDFFVETPVDESLGTSKRIFCGFISIIIFSILILLFTHNPYRMFISIPFSFTFGYSIKGSLIVSNFWEWGKEERRKNREIKEHYDSIARDEYAKEKGRLEAQRKYGDSSSNRSIHIHVNRRSRSNDDFPIKSPQELVDGYNASQKRAEKIFRDTEQDIRRKI